MFASGIAMLVIAPLVGFFSRAIGASLVQTLSVNLKKDDCLKLKLLVGIVPYAMLVFKHYTVAQIVISNIIQGFAIGTTFVAQMVQVFHM